MNQSEVWTAADRAALDVARQSTLVRIIERAAVVGSSTLCNAWAASGIRRIVEPDLVRLRELSSVDGARLGAVTLATAAIVAALLNILS